MTQPGPNDFHIARDDKGTEVLRSGLEPVAVMEREEKDEKKVDMRTAEGRRLKAEAGT